MFEQHHVFEQAPVWLKYIPGARSEAHGWVVSHLEQMRWSVYALTGLYNYGSSQSVWYNGDELESVVSHCAGRAGVHARTPKP